jgi:5-methyltetrahydropteroyltriglutamate--homocysteine methyltransferase
VDLGILRTVPGKRFAVGVLNLADDSPVEEVAAVEARIRHALQHVAPERLLVAPDCGMKYLARDKAFAKLCVMAEAAAKVRAELL